MNKKAAERLEIERDNLRSQVTSENMRKAVLTKQNGAYQPINFSNDEDGSWH